MDASGHARQGTSGLNKEGPTSVKGVKSMSKVRSLNTLNIAPPSTHKVDAVRLVPKELRIGEELRILHFSSVTPHQTLGSSMEASHGFTGFWWL